MKTLRRLLALFRRSRLDREMDDEMRAPLERETERNTARGMSADEARRASSPERQIHSEQISDF
jgi:hypothetical protein